MKLCVPARAEDADMQCCACRCSACSHVSEHIGKRTAHGSRLAARSSHYKAQMCLPILESAIAAAQPLVPAAASMGDDG